ncbi:hypothetical protein, conserved [Eimeria maxima]|uniref:Uncharacterized protein n=1 Tax=Eimeria maxima TaxID=5804 RepID=U6M0M8_EIMMA|nr:hypothetical protein, conserved [Eimeria maxima]CDJ57531.1 hypothetical protein, conserved [Eimeria maxima]
MANNREQAPYTAVCDSDISQHASSGLELSCNISQPGPSNADPTAVHQPQSSRQVYRQLFFDCKLHVVLQKLLSRNRTGGVAPDDAPPETRDSAELQLTDTEVARLMRQHLNILISSQSATEAEVIKAAKTLEQRFAQPAADASQSRTIDVEIRTDARPDWDSFRPRSSIHAEGGIRRESQADSMRPANCQISETDCTQESQASYLEHNITGLPLSQTQDAPTAEQASNSESPQGLLDSAFFSAVGEEVHYAAPAEGGENPRKKLCRKVLHRV